MPPKYGYGLISSVALQVVAPCRGLLYLFWGAHPIQTREPISTFNSSKGVVSRKEMTWRERWLFLWLGDVFLLKPTGRGEAFLMLNDLLTSSRTKCKFTWNPRRFNASNDISQGKLQRATNWWRSTHDDIHLADSSAWLHGFNWNP